MASLFDEPVQASGGEGLVADLNPQQRAAVAHVGGALLIVAGAAGFARAGDQVEVDFVTGLCRNHTTGTQLQAPALAPVMREIVEAGGGIEHMKRVIAGRAAAAATAQPAA